MQELTADGRRIVDDVAQRNGFSSDAVQTMLQAIANGNGSQAQFNHYEFGGMGQWSQGGMIMIGDMFNNNLKFRVDALCNDLSNVWRNNSVYAPQQSFQSQSQGGYSNQSSNFGNSSLFVPGPNSGNWWPGDLGSPSSSGSQNDMRYAVFPSSRRLAIRVNGDVTVYDIGDHQIGGFSQQQGGDQSLTFTSQYGTIRVLDLVKVSGPGMSNGTGNANMGGYSNTNFAQPVQQPQYNQAPAQFDPPAPAPSSFSTQSQNAPSGAQSSGFQSQAPMSNDDIFAKIERLASLRDKGILSDDEFAAKKTELLSRL